MYFESYFILLIEVSSNYYSFHTHDTRRKSTGGGRGTTTFSRVFLFPVPDGLTIPLYFFYISLQRHHYLWDCKDLFLSAKGQKIPLGWAISFPYLFFSWVCRLDYGLWSTPVRAWFMTTGETRAVVGIVMIDIAQPVWTGLEGIVRCSLVSEFFTYGTGGAQRPCNWCVKVREDQLTTDGCDHTVHYWCCIILMQLLLMLLRPKVSRLNYFACSVDSYSSMHAVLYVVWPSKQPVSPAPWIAPAPLPPSPSSFLEIHICKICDTWSTKHKGSDRQLEKGSLPIWVHGGSQTRQVAVRVDLAQEGKRC